MKKKFSVIYKEETLNPCFSGFFRIIISDGDEFFFGYYDEVDEDISISPILEEGFGLLDNTGLDRLNLNIELLLATLQKTKNIAWEERINIIKDTIGVKPDNPINH